MKKLLLVPALSLAMIFPASAMKVPPAPVVPSTGGSVPWIIPCIGGGAAGLILAALVVGRTQNRELTQQEALGTAFTCGLGAFWVMAHRPAVAAPAPAPARAPARVRAKY